MTDKQEKQSTRERILTAAGELFATQGFAATTIRDICEKAKANVAAVNYHFRDKEGLYNELIKAMERELRETAVMSVADTPALPPAERLYSYVYNLLFRRLDPDRPKWKIILFHNELEKPSSFALNMFRELVHKEQEILRAIIEDILGADSNEETVVLCSHSVFGQIFFFFHIYGPILHDIMKKLALKQTEEPLTRERIARLARHITDFSLAAMARFCER
ncbi:TetR/AcrR family transcriptional regulator [candidate division CSSED10-310 bacterium]|uniref:TetR/AcrR family transcriptional regulator n=1 Tax=candidate division CSSED10-310 bacterium TaxID=2855610 RepID=A0ABV6YW33_UNCC1